MPALSVIVPIYRVEDYLLPCLTSLAEQTLGDLEVILVDDGSPDRSGQLAEEFAAGRSGWRVLHVENGGLGRARNIGMDHATADFVAFVDSDDLVPRDAYELMLHAVRESGSDMVVGGVLRFDGANTFTSPLHRRAITRVQMRTHISRTPELIYDTTAWNKVYRRSFLDEHELRFPEGVYYEDIPLTLPAHFLASSVDVLTDPVYLWRERQTTETSITQRRAETKNLVDRLAAVSSVDDFLTRTGNVDGKAIHDRKVLADDIPLFLSVLHEGDEEFQQTLVRLAAEYLRRVPATLLASQRPLRRLQYHLIERGLLTELLELHEFDRVPDNRGRFIRSGSRMYADLPFRLDAALAVPSAVYEVTRSQPLHTGLRDVRWEPDGLVLDGHAFINRVPFATRLSALRRVQLRRTGSPARERLSSRTVIRPDLTGRTTGEALSYDAAGFRTTVPSSLLALRPGESAADFEVVVQVAARSARRGGTVGNPELGRARHPARQLVLPDQIAIPTYVRRTLTIAVRRREAVLDGAAVTADGITLTVRALAGADLADRVLFLRRTDALNALLVPLEDERGDTWTATVSADQLEVRAESLGDRVWQLGLGRPGQDTAADMLVPLDLAPSADDMHDELRGRALVVRQEGPEGAIITDTRPGLVVEEFRFAKDGLSLSGTYSGDAPSALTLATGSGETHQIGVLAGQRRWSATLPSAGAPGETVLRWLQPGRWRVMTATADENQRLVAVAVSSAAEQRLDVWGQAGPVRAELRSDPHHDLQLVVDASGDWADRGALNRERARRYWYRVHFALPQEDTVLFCAWKGRQFSDSPRAIHDELVRRRDPRRRVWVITSHNVEVPEDVETVLFGSREYFRHLARARWLVSNDSMPTHYRKRPGQVYVQTWHGTPLKRIGFDIDNLQMSNPKYLEQFAVEVTTWDALVSPNAFSTEILARAFRFDGPVLQTGYPRNDVFHRDDEREARAAAVRRRLDLPEDKRIVMYAPTWRDNVFNASGRYLFSMKLDLERVHREFGDDSILLIRGHHLVASGLDTSMFGGSIRNVSLYPDISDLYLVADVLVTDYSSVMFDFVNTGRPMIFFAYDLESYRDDLRGFYFDFEAEAPGPVVTTNEEVMALLRDIDGVQADYRERYDAFRARFASLEDGRAAARVIDQGLSARGVVRGG